MVLSPVVRQYGESALLLASLLVTGCSFKADYGGTRFRCDLDEPGACPPGQSCVSGFCERGGEPSGDGDDGVGDGALADADVDRPDGPVADAFVVTCDSVLTFVDSFDTDDNWTEVASQPECDISFANNQLTLGNDLGAPIEQCAVYSVGQFALDSRTWIAVVSPGDNGHPAATFGVKLGDESILFRRVEDFIDLLSRDEKTGVETVELKVNANDPAQRFWALNPSEDGYVHWELSPDGLEWTEYAQFKPQVRPAAGCARYEISIVGDPTGAVDVIFDELNVPPPDPLDGGPS
jgi:hypothetical protein